jgi:pyruvate/2-oxoglutarate/acetoin dehydrogenase E1 component
MTATMDRAPASKKMRYQQCIGLAIEHEMLRDERVFAMGQDLTTLGGQFGLSRGLIDKFGHNRVRDTGVVETFMVGAACGAAHGGAVPVVDNTL